MAGAGRAGAQGHSPQARAERGAAAGAVAGKVRVVGRGGARSDAAVLGPALPCLPATPCDDRAALYANQNTSIMRLSAGRFAEDDLPGEAYITPQMLEDPWQHLVGAAGPP